MRLEAGYQVTPHVRLVRPLRKGGMGSVWTAEHLALHTHVAVKFMSAAFTEDEAMVTRFTREAAYAAQIKSPHVVHVYDHGITEDGLPFIVMELLEGEDLAERLQRLGPLPLLELAKILSHVCKALGKAHQAGIVHRDIKLNNVFLTDTDGDVFAKLLDFGIAKQHGTEGKDVTTTGAMVGTLVYMSPEQLHNAKDVDFRTDLWSLAVVAYRALTGKLPFRDDDGIGALLLAVGSGKFTPASALRPELPAAVDGWFQRGLARDPALRFASAREMSEAFDLAVGREPTAVASSRASALPFARPVAPTVLDPAERPSAASGGAARVESPSSSSVAHAQTIASVEPTRAGRSRGLVRVALAGLALGVVGALSVALLNRSTPPAGPASVAVEPTAPAGEQLPGAVPAALPGAAGAPAITPAVAPLPAASAAAAPPSPAEPAGAAPSSSAAPSASSAALPSGGRTAAPQRPPPQPSQPPPPPPTKPTGPKPGGTIKKEKDYGF